MSACDDDAEPLEGVTMRPGEPWSAMPTARLDALHDELNTLRRRLHEAEGRESALRGLLEERSRRIGLLETELVERRAREYWQAERIAHLEEEPAEKTEAGPANRPLEATLASIIQRIENLEARVNYGPG